jgi:hypothetical protein
MKNVFKSEDTEYGVVFLKVQESKEPGFVLELQMPSPGITTCHLTLKEEEELLAFLFERKNAREPNQIDQLVKRRELTEMRRKAGYDDAPHCVSDMIAAFCQHLNVPMIAWSISIVIENEEQFKRWFSDNYPPIL